jgi:hypothetical protein
MFVTPFCRLAVPVTLFSRGLLHFSLDLKHLQHFLVDFFFSGLAMFVTLFYRTCNVGNAF